MANVPALISETQSLLKKAGKTTANETDVVKWFDELRRRLSRKVKIRRQWTLAVTSGTAEYLLPVASYPILGLTHVFYIPAGATTGEPVDLLGDAERWQEGVRFQIALPGETSHILRVYPDTYSGTLELHGYLQMGTLTNSDASTPQIPEDFHDLFALWAASRFGGQDEDFTGAGRFPNYERQFLMREQEFVAAMNTGARPGARFVRRRW